jgi:hypothetical protein
MAGNRLDAGNHFLISDVIGCADKARIPAVHQDRPILVGVPAQGGDELPPLHVS